MKCNLCKVPYTFKDKKGVERTRYNLVLVFDNGTFQYIQSNQYTTTSKDKMVTNEYNNYDVLVALADLVNSKDDLNEKK